MRAPDDNGSGVRGLALGLMILLLGCAAGAVALALYNGWRP